MQKMRIRAVNGVVICCSCTEWLYVVHVQSGYMLFMYGVVICCLLRVAGAKISYRNINMRHRSAQLPWVIEEPRTDGVFKIQIKEQVEGG